MIYKNCEYNNILITCRGCYYIIILYIITCIYTWKPIVRFATISFFFELMLNVLIGSMEPNFSTSVQRIKVFSRSQMWAFILCTICIIHLQFFSIHEITTNRPIKRNLVIILILLKPSSFVCRYGRNLEHFYSGCGWGVELWWIMDIPRLDLFYHLWYYEYVLPELNVFTFIIHILN